MKSVSIDLNDRECNCLFLSFVAYVFTVRNLFDWLARRSARIFAQDFEKRQSEDYRRKSRVSFNIETY